MEYKTEVMDALSLSRSLKRITHEILEKNKGTDNLVLVGIKRRGVPLANIIKGNIKAIEGIDVPVCTLDITFYRDDLTKENDEPLIKDFKLEHDINNKTVILVDDVIYTGRTVRAAMDALLTSARPNYIELAVVVDRGHRELPIRPDFVGKNVPTSKDEHINVSVEEIDGVNGVYLIKNTKWERIGINLWNLFMM